MAKASKSGTVGFIGLGRMGSRIVERLLEKKFDVVVYNRSPEPMRDAKKAGAIIASDYVDVVKKLQKPRTLWIMVSAGKPVDEVLHAVMPSLEEGDVVIDGGNSNYKDSVRRADLLKDAGIFYLDVGTSGGLEGARKGACLTIGGERAAYDAVKNVFDAIAASGGQLYTGKSGSGHFVKMVHNAIEYGMLEAYGEGFEMLQKSEYSLDLAKIAKVWGSGSVVRSWLLELCHSALDKDEKMEGFSGEIGGGETGGWAAEYASARGIEIPVIRASLDVRGRKGDADRYAGKVVGAIRKEFGGHEMKKK